jgi:predicted nucleic acid-binding protein
MYLLDTNVLSELRRRNRTHPKVAAWADATVPADLYVSAITIMELETGALLIGRKDQDHGALLRDWIEHRILPAFDGRILPVDTAVARCCAALHVPVPRPQRDSLIAATALIHRLTVVTRNVGDFEPMNVSLLNPWAGE